MRNVFSVGYRAYVGLAAALLLGLSASFCVAGPYSDAVLSNNPVLYWQLNETSGSTAANLGTGGAALNGTYQNVPGPGSPSTNTSNYGVAGPSHPGLGSGNTAVHFVPENPSAADGTLYPRVDLASPSGSALGFTNALTLEAWVKRDAQTVSAGNNEGIVGRFIGSSGGSSVSQRSYILYYDSNATPATDVALGSTSGGAGALAFQVSSTGANITSQLMFSTVNIPVDEWTHVAAVYDGASATRTMSIYVNGVLSGQITDGVLGRVVPASLYTGDSTFQIGQQFSGSSLFAFEGSIDEVAAYGTALNGSTILANYQSAIVPEPTSFALESIGMTGITAIRRRRKS